MKVVLILPNSVDPDGMQYYIALHRMCLHCLSNHLLMGFQYTKD